MHIRNTSKSVNVCAENTIHCNLRGRFKPTATASFQRFRAVVSLCWLYTVNYQIPDYWLNSCTGVVLSKVPHGGGDLTKPPHSYLNKRS